MSQSQAATTAAVLLVLLAGVSPGRHDRDRARLSINQPLKNLGSIAAEQELAVPFELRNRGSRRLICHEIDTACGCGDKVLRTIIIPPGETALVIVRLDIRGPAGLTEASAKFISNDPEQPSFVLAARASIVPGSASHAIAD